MFYTEILRLISRVRALKTECFELVVYFLGFQVPLFKTILPYILLSFIATVHIEPVLRNFLYEIKYFSRIFK